MLRGLVDTPERRRLFVAGTLTFLAIGAVQAMYGPAFPAFQARYHVGVGRVGAVVSAHFLGSFVTIAASGVLLGRFGYRRLLLAGAAGLTLGAAGVALSPAWSLMLVAALVAGLGFGLLDVATNLLFARGYGERATGALNLLNAAFALGAVVGPVLVGLLAPRVAPAFLLVAAVVALSGMVAWRAPMPRPLLVSTGVLRAPRGPLLGFMVLYFFYVAAEVGVASWEPTYLAPVLGDARAAVITGLYWAALALGRFVAAAVSDAVRPADMVLGAVLLALGALWLAGSVALAPVAFALVGLAFAPVFPTALAWLQQVFPQRAEQVTPLVIAGANLGPVLTAPVIGWVIAWSGTARVPLVLGSLVLALSVAVALLWRSERGANRRYRRAAASGRLEPSRVPAGGYPGRSQGRRTVSDSLPESVLEEFKHAYRAQKALGDGALAQLEDGDVRLRLDPGSNTIATLVKHLRGNMVSRWSDFLTSDGEKAGRRRDAEFEADDATLAEVLDWWAEGWRVVLEELEALRPGDLGGTVRIRGEAHTVPRALLRQLAHTAQHVGQIVLLAKHARGERWVTLSIPRGGTAAFNRDKGFTPGAPR